MYMRTKEEENMPSENWGRQRPTKKKTVKKQEKKEIKE